MSDEADMRALLLAGLSTDSAVEGLKAMRAAGLSADELVRCLGRVKLAPMERLTDILPKEGPQ